MPTIEETAREETFNMITGPTGVYEALAAAAGSMGAIPKDQRNEAQGFQFRSIESIVAAAKPILAENGLSITPTAVKEISTTSVKDGRGYRVVVAVQWRISHIDGSSISASMLGEAVDYGDKATSKAVQMAYKYMLTQMLGIGSEDPDGESVELADEVSTADQIILRTNAVKAAIYKEADEDADAAASVWTGLLDGLTLEGVELGLEHLDEIEKVWEEREL